MNNNLTVEDLILCIAGQYPIPHISDIKILHSDKKLINSFAKQINTNVGFTDRQYELAKRKIDDYSEYFELLDLDSIKKEIRMPIRSIDRRRWIKIIHDEGDIKIAVRFIYSNKLISSLEQIRRKLKEQTEYDKENKTHYFSYSERNLFEIVNAFNGKHFELDPTVEAIYNKIVNFTPEENVPGVYNLTVKNIPDNALNALEKEIGPLSIDTLYLYKERSIKYGLHHFDLAQVEKSLFTKNNFIKNICNRKTTDVILDPADKSIADLILDLEDLKKLPILIVLDKTTCHDMLIEFQDQIKNIIPNNKVSVMFRLDNVGEGAYFNSYIKQQGLNNKLDKDIKIVYTLDNKVPKPLLTNNWNPESILITQTFAMPALKKVIECFNNKDLIIHYDKDSQNRKFYTGKELEKV